ncbi:MAG TPA: TetR/AcrR family transcriptional regulator [Acidimicrobiales bacterium]|jgi:AcrR family transcriptional regulator|nr:TetR/AcrR family transcriptional regulator [Acidimicrobiales bacterium]
MARRTSAPTVAAVADDPLPSRASSDGTLRRLQHAALELFAERGYHGVSMRELAAATGVQPSSLYSHMPSKERLLLDLVVLGHEEHRDRLRAALLESGDDPAEQLASVVRAHVGFHVEFPTLATVVNNELHALSEDGQREVRLIRGDAERTIVDIVERGVRLGSFHVPDVWLAAAAIGGMGIRAAAWFRQGNYTPGEVADTYAEFALRIVGAR